MKKIFLIILTILITGCATQKPYVEVAPIKPDSEIMGDCGDYIIPKNSFKSFADAIYDNKLLFEDCKKQNKAKKNFIEKITQ